MDLPIFYHQVLFAWGECQELCTPRHKNAWDIRREVLFFNKAILIDKRYDGEHYANFFEHNIIMLHDILDKNGTF